MDACLEVLRSVFLPLVETGEETADLVLPVREIGERILPVAEIAEDGGGDGRIADGTVFVEYTVYRAPAFLDDHELPDAPAHVGFHVLLERHVIGICTCDTAHLSVEYLLADAGRESLGLGYGVADHVPGLRIVVELKDVRIVGHLDHAGDLLHADRKGSVGILFLEQPVHQLAVLEIGLLHPPVEVGLVHQVPHHQAGLVLEGRHEEVYPLVGLRQQGRITCPASAADDRDEADAARLTTLGEVPEPGRQSVTQLCEALVRNEYARHVELETLGKIEVEIYDGLVVLHPGVDMMARLCHGRGSVVETAYRGTVDGILVNFLNRCGAGKEACPQKCQN